MKSLTGVIIKNSKRQELTNTSKFLTIFAFLIVAGFLSSIMIGFSIMATTRLKEYNQAYAFVNMLFLMNFIVLFSESIFHSLNTLYFSKDLNVFLRLPIKPKDLVSAKIKDMIISQYEMEILMLAIPATIYGIIMNVSISFYVFLLVILLVLPIIPITIITLIISVIMRFTNFIKNKSKVMYITIAIALIVLWFIISGFGGKSSTLSTSSFENLILQADGLAKEIANRFILIKPIMNSLLNYNNIEGIKNLSIFLIESFLVYNIGIFIISKIYLKGAIGTVINGQKFRKKLDVLDEKDLKRKNKYKSYFLKELKITARSPIFLIQCIIMPILYPIFVVVFIIAIFSFAQKIRVDIVKMLLNLIDNGFGYTIFLSLAQGFFMLNFSSIIAVSKEGKSATLSKAMPIGLDMQFKLKSLIGIGVNTIPILIICFSYYYLYNNILNTILMFIILEMLNSFGEKWKILVDLNNPQIKWNTEYTMMKQNTNIMYELFYTIIVIILLILAGRIFEKILYTEMFILYILLCLNFVMNRHIKSKEHKIFKNLY